MPDVADVSPSSGNRGSGGLFDPAYGGRPLDPADERLVERVADGDASALADLYDRYARAAYSLARRICGDDGRAEEVLRETFLAVWRDPQRFDPERGRFVSWLLTVVHHRALDAALGEGARPSGSRERGQADWAGPVGSTPRSATPGAAVPGSDPAGSALAGQVGAALAQLPEEQRRTLALAYFGGFTLQEISSITRSSPRAVEGQLFKAVLRLRRLLVPSRWQSAQSTGGLR